MMMIDFAGCRLSAKDFQICSGLLRAIEGTNSHLAPLLREKIERAVVVPAERMDPLVVTLNSRVAFAVDDGATETRILVQNEFRHGLAGMTLPIAVPRGLALLGLRQGQSASFEEHGRNRDLFVRYVLYQPEARPLLHDGVPRYGPPAEIIELDRMRDARRRSYGDCSPMPS